MIEGLAGIGENKKPPSGGVGDILVEVKFVSIGGAGAQTVSRSQRLEDFVLPNRQGGCAHHGFFSLLADNRCPAGKNLYTNWHLAEKHRTSPDRAFGWRTGSEPRRGDFAWPFRRATVQHFLPALSAANRSDLPPPKAHYDTNALTLLLPDPVGGFEVQLTDGSWAEVKPLEGAYVVNVGNMMAAWSDGRFKSAMHRVNPPPGVERYSIAFFTVPGL